MKTRSRYIVGPGQVCVFLMCTLLVPHEHEACETCGTLRHGNLSCVACRRFHGIQLPGLDVEATS